MTREPLKPATALFPPSAERERCENFLTHELLEANLFFDSNRSMTRIIFELRLINRRWRYYV
jgi:hypothetical protein